MITDWSKYKYVNPLFKQMLEEIPVEERRESDLSAGIACRIGDILERKGWSQADFARAAGKKEAEISKWMSGQHNFTIRTIAYIETVLGEGILSVRQYRTSKPNIQETASDTMSLPIRKKNYSSYAPGLLNDEGDEKYVAKKKKSAKK